MATLLLGREATAKLLDMPRVLAAVEEAFLLWAQGRAAMPAKAYLVVERGDFRAMPAAIPGAAGVKWVNVHTGNRERGLPTVMAIFVYSDPETGYPLAVMDGTGITAYRTGAAAAIASKYLARKDATTLGLIGAGRQAETQVLAHTEFFTFKEIRVHDRSAAAIETLAASLPRFSFEACSLEAAVASDIVVTLTPLRSPLVKREWVLPGTHLNAVGADAAGKQELDPAILCDARVVVDDVRQATAAGELNVPLSRGDYRVEDVHATLGAIVNGDRPGRSDDSMITVFDSTGVAIEDVAVARLIYEAALAEGDYPWIELV